MRLQPILGHLSSQSNSSNMIAMFSVLLHPLESIRKSRYFRIWRSGGCTNVQLVALFHISRECGLSDLEYLPFVIDGLDDKAQGRTDTVDIFSHDFLYDSRLSSIVQSAIESTSSLSTYTA